MNTFVAVFSVTPDTTPVFWGAFANHPDAHTAVDNFLAERKYWKREDFEIHEFPFGVLL
jgi:hypothetical protein